MTKVKNADGAAQQMAERMQNTTIGAYKEFLSAAESIAISFGSVLLPQLAEIMRYGAGWANQLSTLAEQHPQLSKAIGYTVIGLISLKISAIAVGYAFTFVRGAWLSAASVALKLKTFLGFLWTQMLKNKAIALASGFKQFGMTLWTLVKGAIPAAVTGVKLLGRALLLNPIGLAITAIAVGAFLIIKYWEPIKAFFVNLWEGISAGAQKVWEKIKKVTEPIAKLKQAVGSVWNKLFGSDDDKKAVPATARQPEVGQAVVADVGKNIDPLNSKVKTAIANDNSARTTVHNNITVNAAKGMDEATLAREVGRVMDERERQIASRKRALNYG